MTNMVGFDIYKEDPGALRTVLIFIILLVLKYANTPGFSQGAAGFDDCAGRRRTDER
jgi:hypothetical protein